MPPAQKEAFSPESARPGPDPGPNVRAIKMRPNPSELSACGRRFGRWVLAIALACGIDGAVAAPAPQPPAKRPATATQATKKDERCQTAAPTAIQLDGESGS